MSQGSCPYCGTLMGPEAAPGGLPDTRLCPTCGQESDAPAQPSLPPGARAENLAALLGREPAAFAAARAGRGPAWEGEGGLISRAWRTIWQMLLHPMRTMAAPPAPGYRWPLSFMIIMSTLSGAAQAFWSRFMGWEGMPQPWDLVFVCFLPLLAIPMAHVVAAVFHVLLWVCRGARGGYVATFRAVAYANASGIFTLVPGLGPFLGTIWGLIISVGALSQVHQTSRLRVFMAVIVLPVVIIALLLAAAVAAGLWAFLSAALEAGGLPWSR